MRNDSPEGPVVGLAGPDGFPHLWLGPAGRPRRSGRCTSRSPRPRATAVDAVFAAARETGTEILHEPRIWPEYHPGYYGVFFRDPDGNNVEAVHHTFRG